MKTLFIYISWALSNRGELYKARESRKQPRCKCISFYSSMHIWIDIKEKYGEYFFGLTIYYP